MKRSILISMSFLFLLFFSSSSSSSSFSRSLAVAGLSAMLLLQAQTADAKVVLKQSEAKKVFQPAPVEKKAPKGPRKPKEKKAGGGFTAPKFNAPTLSAPSISLSGPLGTLAFVLGSVGLFVGAALSYAKVDDGWWEFINEAMAKDVTGYAGNESDLKK
mmetsp:Transcript_1371/g.4475  ORF Transcript_1371/g.4475 Transcript_1371/m.4475 type:complete len:159 (+) Transcript_1371:190-666(+)